MQTQAYQNPNMEKWGLQEVPTLGEQEQVINSCWAET